MFAVNKCLCVALSLCVCVCVCVCVCAYTQVWVWVVDAGNEQVAQLYLTGLGLPAASTQANQYTTTATTA